MVIVMVIVIVIMIIVIVPLLYSVVKKRADLRRKQVAA
jgi:hypothetical protein